jgi:hypothetical protein
MREKRRRLGPSDVLPSQGRHLPLSRCGAHRRIRALSPGRCALGTGGEDGVRLRWRARTETMPKVPISRDTLRGYVLEQLLARLIQNTGYRLLADASQDPESTQRSGGSWPRRHASGRCPRRAVMGPGVHVSNPAVRRGQRPWSIVRDRRRSPRDGRRLGRESEGWPSARGARRTAAEVHLPVCVVLDLGVHLSHPRQRRQRRQVRRRRKGLTRR